MPRQAGHPGPPLDYVDGEFLSGRVRPGSPVGVADAQALAQNVSEALRQRDLPLSTLAVVAGVDRTTIHDLLAGRAYVTIVTLARLEHALGCRLWPGPAGVN